MKSNFKDQFNHFIEHYLVICLWLTLVILTYVGAGNVILVSLLGLMLCAIGFVQPNATVDYWLFVPLVLYNLLSLLSSYVTYGNIIDGYVAVQMVYVVIYLLLVSLSSKERFLLQQLAVLWASVVAVAGIGQFVYDAIVWEQAKRLGGFLSNPNALGIFLVISWLALLSCVERESDQQNVSRLSGILGYLEPLLLVALALTLSMGSFIAMAAGILVLIAAQKRQSSLTKAWQYGSELLAKASLGIGTGVLIYLAAARSHISWSCLPLLLYVLYLVISWKKFGRFLRVFPRCAAMISAIGVLVAGVTVMIRPNAITTFAERLEMMRNGWDYLIAHPFWGVGPYRWRILNLYDSDKYFNTWHIHNTLLHIAVELGGIAALLLIIMLVRCWRTRKKAVQKAQIASFFAHNLLDVSFFYLGITTMCLITIGESFCQQTLPKGIMQLLLALMLMMFGCNLYCCLMLTG